MLQIVKVTKPESRASIRQVLEEGQRSYRIAMADMRQVYERIQNDDTFFGIARDFIPLPQLQGFATNGFETIFERASNKVQLAKQREDAALQADQSFNIDAAAFQSELTQIRNTYENQLGDLCGMLTTDDGQLRPAIRRYAHLDARATVLGDPCGLLGQGQIYEAIVQVGQAQLDIQHIAATYDNVFKEIDIEVERVSQQCNLLFDTAQYVYQQQDKISTLEDAIGAAKVVVQTATSSSSRPSVPPA